MLKPQKEPEYTDEDIREYLRLLQRKAEGYDGPDPKQWRGIEKFISHKMQD